MMLKLKPSILLIILCSILFCSCQKEYSLEGNVVGGSAVFTFTGAPGACSNAVVSGTYQPGVALGASNIVTIAVDVTTAGSYTLLTTTINGISFSGSGSFTATGPQTISLTGTGIPLAGGTFSFTPGANGCPFPVIIGGGGSAVYVFNGAPGNCTSFSPGGTFTAGTTLTTGNFAVVSVDVATIGTYNITTNTNNGISFSATGTFTATGTQLVQLSGSGTPLVAGVFDFTPGANSCTFSITVTGGASTTAVYTYGGAPGNCTSATPAGTYTAGTALTASNTITIPVNVSTTGTYSISTPVVNGFSFSGTGNFPVAGVQTVTLTGAGIPTAPGLFNFTPSNNGCSFPVTVLAGPVVTDFITCNIDGVAKTFNVALLAGSADPTSFDFSGDETAASTTPFFVVGLTKAPAITTGVYNRFTVTNFTTFCLVGYSDGVSSTGWASGLSGQAGGFTVNVTALTANRIQGNFAGTLYNNDGLGTGTKVITNGLFSIPY